MKKIFAILLAFAMLFAFAACDSNKEENTTTTAEDIFAGLEDKTTEAPSSEDTTAASDVATSDPTATDTTAAEGESTTASSGGLNSTDIAEVVAFYNAARKNTSPAPAGKSSMKLASKIEGDGAMGAILSVLSPAVESALANNSTDTDYIPANGHEDIKPSDVTKAVATSKNGVTTIAMEFKTQVDGSNGDPKNGGPVARGIGTLGSIDIALSELGAELDAEGRKTVKLTYDDAYLKCTINEKTGMITGGTWHHQVNVYIGNAKGSIGILSATFKNMTAIVDYSVVI